MAQGTGTFSESWYRVAGQHIYLRPHVGVRRQFFRGQRWYVLSDPFNNQFFRLHPAAYEFVSRLRADRTVEQVWEECLRLHPDEAPGQEDVIRLLAQLYYANLLQYGTPADTEKLFGRYKKRRTQETQSFFLNIMFARFPLLDPDRFLERWLPIVGRLIHPLGALVWIAVVIAAGKVAIEHFAELREQTQAVLAPGNLFLLYAGLVLVKTLHEFGHAFACKKFGGEVHVMGIMLLIFTPIPFVDATSAWAFRSRWQRILVGSAGMLVELFVAACATFVWAYTGPGTLHSLAYNMIFIASVSTILFNANPLLRYDGYYILSDLLDIPNLYMRATQQLRHLAEGRLFGYKHSESPAQTRREAFWLATYGLLSGAYRVVVFTGILLFVADRFLLLGIVMALVCVISWVVVPIIRFIHYIAASPRLERQRPRAVLVTASAAAVLLLGLGVFPFPYHFRAPGVLRAERYAYIANGSSGYLEEVLAQSGAIVAADQPLLRLADPELDMEIARALAQYEESEALYRRAMQRETADLDPIARRLAVIRERLARLDQQKADLIVRSSQTGRWIAPDVDEYVGTWVPRGTALGQVVDENSFIFSAIVAQREASRLFAGEIRGSEVRLLGQAGSVISVTRQLIIPAEQEYLPSAALGWLSGGEVAVDVTDPTGRRAAETFFEVRSTLGPASGALMLHGRSGKIRFELNPQPLLRQWVRKLRQLLQQRYQI